MFKANTMLMIVYDPGWGRIFNAIVLSINIGCLRHLDFF